MEDQILRRKVNPSNNTKLKEKENIISAQANIGL